MFPNHGRAVSYHAQPTWSLGKALMRTNSTPQTTLLQMQAAEVIADLSQHGHSARGSGGKATKVEIVGPFKTQVHNLSSSDYESLSTDSSPEHHLSPPTSLLANRVVQLKSPGISPKTPTRKGQIVKARLLESPADDYTDWVAYSAPIPELEDVNFDGGNNSFESFVTESTPSHSSTPRTMIERSSDSDRSEPSSAEREEHSLKLAATKRRLRESAVDTPELTPELTPSTSPTPTLVPLPVPFSPKVKKEEASKEASADPSPSFTCDACGGDHARMMLFQPCGDLACPSCFSSSLAAVSVTQSAAKCPCCLTEVSSFDAYNPKDFVPLRRTARPKVQQELEPVVWSFENSHKTVVMRIDNVAWDIEPHLVQSWLPTNTLPVGHPCPVHICINRKDGRTKDYLYFEAASPDAARRVLQKCQNTFMPGGRVTSGRKRPVTVSQVSHSELLREVSPASKAELSSLLELCEAALCTPPPKLRMDSSGRGRLHASVGTNGKVHYLKYRHAPFHALMSLMCELRGDPESPAYWDLFHVASGAIAALAMAIRVRLHHPDDQALLRQFTALFHACFGLQQQDSADVPPSRPRARAGPRRSSPRK